MKSDLLENQNDYFTELLNEYGFNLSKEQKYLLLYFLSLVIEKNKVVNLTAIKSFKDGVVLHLIDSLLFSKLIDLENSKLLLDIGSGGGFPAIPLKIISDMEIHSLDSVNKKLIAQEEFIGSLNLQNFKTIHSRVEDYAKENKYRYDYITARALAPLVILFEYASPLLRLNGELVVSKGAKFNEELKDAQRAMNICGFELKDHINYVLPEYYGSRELVSFRKVRKESINLPRQAGKAKREPLI